MGVNEGRRTKQRAIFNRLLKLWELIFGAQHDDEIRQGDPVHTAPLALPPKFLAIDHPAIRIAARAHLLDIRRNPPDRVAVQLA